MKSACDRIRPLLGAVLDGELEAAAVEPHLSACAPCRAESEAVRALKARISRLLLPAPPRAFAVPRPPRRLGWAAAVAAATLLAVLLGIGTPPTPLLALSAQLHDDILGGRRVLGDLGIAPTATKADYAGRCPCPPDLGNASPFIVYRTPDGPVSLLAVDDRSPGRDEVRRYGADTVLAESRHGLRLVWIARLDEAGLRRAAASLRPAPGVDLRGLTCSACCALLESRGRPGAPASMELLTAPDGSRIDPARVTAFRAR